MNNFHSVMLATSAFMFLYPEPITPVSPQDTAITIPAPILAPAPIIEAVTESPTIAPDVSSVSLLSPESCANGVCGPIRAVVANVRSNQQARVSGRRLRPFRIFRR